MDKYLVKIDVSGIQSFIFDIKSDGAARALKAKSIFVIKLIDFVVDIINNKTHNMEIIYSGGGNALLTLESSKDKLIELNDYLKNINIDGLKIYFHFVKYRNVDFKKNSDELNKQLNNLKYKPNFQNSVFDLNNQNNNKWVDYTRIIYSNKEFNFEINSDNGNLSIPFTSSNLDRDPNMLVPRNNIELKDFTEIAESGVGADYLGSLKMDIDNLGSIFEKLKTKEQFTDLSKLISAFFTNHIYNIIESKFYNKIYVVFSGGDDCFFIAKWNDAIELSMEIQDKFDKYIKENSKKFLTLQDIDFNKVTISASVTIVNHKFPMSRLGTLSEDALHNAKYHSKNKNSISIFGYVISWDDLKKAKDLKNTLVDLIQEKGESKALIQYLIKSHIGFRPLINKANKGKIEIPKVWRLKYYLRNIGKENLDAVEKIFNEYEKSILNNFMNNKSENPDLYLVAARWAELTIKKESENE